MSSPLAHAGRLVVLDFCGTLSQSVTRFNVGDHLAKHGLAPHLDEAAYWTMVQRTWARLSTSSDATFTAVFHDEVARRGGGGVGAVGVDAFLRDYWGSHQVDAAWQDVLAATRAPQIELATSAAVGYAKKDPRFWAALLRGGAGPRVVVATDHYIDAEPAIVAALRPWSVQPVGLGAEGCPRDVVLVDDFGACEQAAAGYAERRRATEEAIRSVLPDGSSLRIVQVTPDGTNHFDSLHQLLATAPDRPATAH
eukprot:TRINITY_DN32718_c0_g1_i1.p1 TRINITY_DN32718_c0_g1~~TRINITY_DN32718_c0_g1_i1.p1  ORF type:complete len:252 (+),score=42.48 TRINITY_DN32718_c0_g1_i1:48-803(+)